MQEIIVAASLYVAVPVRVPRAVAGDVALEVPAESSGIDGVRALAATGSPFDAAG